MPSDLNQHLNELADRIEYSATYEETNQADYVSLDPTQLFDDEPAPLQVFLYDRKYLHLPPLSGEQLNTVIAGTQVYYDATLSNLKWPYLSPNVHNVVCKWGKGSGKDTIARIILSRIAYLLMVLKDPQKYYGIMPGDSINMLNVAYSSKQANVIFFQPLKRVLEASPYFKDKIQTHEDNIEFPKNVFLYSGHSEQESQEGHNLIAAVADEIAAFKTKLELEKKQRRSVRPLEHSADALIDMMESSATSRFPDIYKLIQLSYTRYEGDPICLAYDKYKDNPRAFVSMGATWEINPRRKQEDFAEEYKKDPEKARAKYECKPPKAEDQYFKNFTDEMADDVFPYVEPDRDPMDDMGNIKSWFRGVPGVLYYAHVDLGVSNCDAGVCISHVAGFTEREIVERNAIGLVSKKILREVIIDIDLLYGYVAPLNGEIDIASIRLMLLDLHERKGFRLGFVSYDGYQSTESIQQFKARGVEADVFSLDRNTDGYDTLKEVMYTGRLRAYRSTKRVEDAPVVKELQHLKKITGSKIDHQLGGSKDWSDSLAGAVYRAVLSQETMADSSMLAVGGSYHEIFGVPEQVDLNDWKGHGKFNPKDTFDAF